MTRTVADPVVVPLELPELPELELELLLAPELLELLEPELLELELLELELLEPPLLSSLQPLSRPLAAQAVKSVMTRCLNRIVPPASRFAHEWIPSGASP